VDAEYFDQWFAEIAQSEAEQRLFSDALGVPVEVGPQNLVPLDGLREIAAALSVEPGGLVVDLACGRGGPGMWIARELNAELIGVDFSREAIAQATVRRALFGMQDTATFAVGTFEETGLSAGGADAVVCIDAIQFADDTVAALDEIRRVLRPGGRVVLTSWEPREGADTSALPDRIRQVDLHAALSAAGFMDVERHVKKHWDEIEHAFWSQAATIDPAGDPALESTKEEAERTLPTFDTRCRVMATATAP
jgi:ubiquinone/menaquinone biosynthesis C-methylase UbiE